MMRRFGLAQVLTIATMALAFTATSVSAQFGGSSHPRILQFVVSGGAVVPTGKFKDVHDMGIHADGALILNLPGFPVRLRPELSFTRFNIKDALAQQGGYGDSSLGTSQMVGAIGNIEIPLFMGLYVMAGVGALSLSTDAAAGAETFNGTKFSVDGGAGLRFHFGPIGGFLEGRVNSVYTEQGSIDFKDVKVIPVTFGLVF